MQRDSSYNASTGWGQVTKKSKKTKNEVPNEVPQGPEAETAAASKQETLTDPNNWELVLLVVCGPTGFKVATELEMDVSDSADVSVMNATVVLD